MDLRSVYQEQTGKHHGDQAHSWPTLCHEMLCIFLTAPPSYDLVAFPLRLCAKHMCYGKLATS